MRGANRGLFLVKRCVFFFAEKLIKCSKSLFNILEEPKKKPYLNLGEKHQPIFIVGAPRTGSTILYQMLTNMFDVLYIDNLTCLFNSSFFLGFYLSDRVFKNKAHNCFTSIHGRTLHAGLRAPSECGQFWYRWLPKDRHYIGEGNVTKEQIQQMREDIFSVINHFDKPIVFKNMNIGQRMWLVSQVAPRAKIIFIKRNPLYTAQSILRVRKKVGRDPNYWWSIMPKNYSDLTSLNYHEQIVKQIFFIEKQIYDDSRYFPVENIMTIHYEDLCVSTNDTLSKIIKFVGGSIEKRKGVKPPRIDFSAKRSISDDDFNKFQDEIAQLDWECYRI